MFGIGGWPLSRNSGAIEKAWWEACGTLDVPRGPVGSASCPAGNSDSCPIVGGTHTNFNRVHAEQGHVFVVAASHLIFRFRQPLQARITGNACYVRLGLGTKNWREKIAYPSIVYVYYVHPQIHNLEYHDLG